VRHQFRIYFDNGKSGTCTTHTPIYDALTYFKNRFPSEGINKVEQRFGEERWVDSALLPTCEEEANGLA
jgi:hypothetical protein